jgi:hypothetical protein
MFIEVLMLSLIVGILLGGSIKNFKDAELKHIELIFIAYIIETGVVLLIRKGVSINRTMIFSSHLLMYMILFVFVYINREIYQVLIMGAGFLLNAIAIFSNGGVMPVSSWAIHQAGIDYVIKNGSISSEGLYRLSDSSTVFAFFGDIIPKPYIRAAVVSIGDLVIAVGLFLLVLKLMGCKHKSRGEV